MRSTLRGLGPGLMLCGALLLLAACGDDSQSPPARVEPRAEQLSTDEPGNLAPLDLVYVCGNKFLATNSNRSSVQLTWRVVGSSETGSITLPPGPIEDPGHSETELETAKKGIVELYQDGERVVRRRNLNRPCGAPAVASLMASATAADAGSWTQPFPWPSVAIHLSLLPTGKVLSWGQPGSAGGLGSGNRSVHRGPEPGGAVLLRAYAPAGRAGPRGRRAHLQRPWHSGHQHLLSRPRAAGRNRPPCAGAGGTRPTRCSPTARC